jgi:putative transposase
MDRSRRNLVRYQKRMSRQEKGSKRRHRTKVKLSNTHNDMANVRKDLCHKASRTLVDQKESKVFVLEDLKTRQMTGRAKAKKDDSGRWLKNGAKAKSGLNKAILNVGWHRFEEFLKYKANRAGKAWFKVPAHHTSQECGACAYTHPSSRQSQDLFRCARCGHTDNADHNAAEVIKKRVLFQTLDRSCQRGVFYLSLIEDVEPCVRRGGPKAHVHWAKKRQKRKRKVQRFCLLIFLWKPQPFRGDGRSQSP